jgi:plasmid stabilization system protein ParE
VARVIYAEAAVQDLERIVEFLLEAPPGSAARAVRRIRLALDVLAEHPRIGRRVRAQMRELVISHGASGYLALYRFDPSLELVRVLRVRHQREAGYRD